MPDQNTYPGTSPYAGQPGTTGGPPIEEDPNRLRELEILAEKAAVATVGAGLNTSIVNLATKPANPAVATPSNTVQMPPVVGVTVGEAADQIPAEPLVVDLDKPEKELKEVSAQVAAWQLLQGLNNLKQRGPIDLTDDEILTILADHLPEAIRQSALDVAIMVPEISKAAPSDMEELNIAKAISEEKRIKEAQRQVHLAGGEVHLNNIERLMHGDLEREWDGLVEDGGLNEDIVIEMTEAYEDHVDSVREVVWNVMEELFKEEGSTPWFSDIDYAGIEKQFGIPFDQLTPAEKEHAAEMGFAWKDDKTKTSFGMDIVEEAEKELIEELTTLYPDGIPPEALAEGMETLIDRVMEHPLFIEKTQQIANNVINTKHGDETWLDVVNEYNRITHKVLPSLYKQRSGFTDLTVQRNKWVRYATQELLANREEKEDLGIYTPQDLVNYVKELTSIDSDVPYAQQTIQLRVIQTIFSGLSEWQAANAAGSAMERHDVRRYEKLVDAVHSGENPNLPQAPEFTTNGIMFGQSSLNAKAMEGNPHAQKRIALALEESQRVWEGWWARSGQEPPLSWAEFSGVELVPDANGNMTPIPMGHAKYFERTPLTLASGEEVEVAIFHNPLSTYNAFMTILELEEGTPGKEPSTMSQSAAMMVKDSFKLYRASDAELQELARGSGQSLEEFKLHALSNIAVVSSLVISLRGETHTGKKNIFQAQLGLDDFQYELLETFSMTYLSRAYSVEGAQHYRTPVSWMDALKKGKIDANHAWGKLKGLEEQTGEVLNLLMNSLSGSGAATLPNQPIQEEVFNQKQTSLVPGAAHLRDEGGVWRSTATLEESIQTPAFTRANLSKSALAHWAGKDMYPGIRDPGILAVTERGLDLMKARGNLENLGIDYTGYSQAEQKKELTRLVRNGGARFINEHHLNYLAADGKKIDWNAKVKNAKGEMVLPDIAVGMGSYDHLTLFQNLSGADHDRHKGIMTRAELAITIITSNMCGSADTSRFVSAAYNSLYNNAYIMRGQKYTDKTTGRVHPASQSVKIPPHQLLIWMNTGMKGMGLLEQQQTEDDTPKGQSLDE